jgi:hypothetical protein
MIREECTAFNEMINLGGQWDVVDNAVREVAQSVPTEDLEKPVETEHLQRDVAGGTMASEPARWLPSFLEGKKQTLVAVHGGLALS